MATLIGTQENQPVNDNATIDPFEHVLIAGDPGGDTVTISFNAANGILVDPNAPSDNSVFEVLNGIGTYTVNLSDAQLTAWVDALQFVPTAHQVAPGQTVTTGFTIQVQSAFGFLTLTDNATSVIATAVGPIISGTQPNQAVNDNATIDPFARPHSNERSQRDA
jgi:hypothetical protein